MCTCSRNITVCRHLVCRKASEASPEAPERDGHRVSGQGETSQIKSEDFLNAITHLIPADKVPALRACTYSE